MKLRTLYSIISIATLLSYSILQSREERVSYIEEYNVPKLVGATGGGGGGIGAIPVSQGGTGRTSVTIHNLLVGNGTNPLNLIAPGTNGQILLGSTGADAAFGSLTSTLETINFTTGAGSLALDVNDALLITTGFDSWDGAGPYFNDSTLGSFTLLQSGTGYINTQPISWTAPQTVTGMTAGNTYYLYIDSTGTLQKTTTANTALYQNNIVLFECMRDSTTPTNNQITVKENHAFNMPQATYDYLNELIGIVIDNSNQGANITLVGTQQITLLGADVLNDSGLTTTIPDGGGVGLTWRQMYTNAIGKWATNDVTDTFTGEWNNSGTVTALGAGRFGIYRLYIAKDSLNSSNPVYVAVLDAADYPSLVAANAAMTAGLPSIATAELEALKLAQLGLIIYSQAANSIVSVLIQKTTLGSTVSSGGTNLAALVQTNTATFDGILSAADTNVQHALETIDDWGKDATNNGVLIGRGVNTPITAVASVSPAGIPLISQGAGSDPVYGTALVVGGGTGVTSYTTGDILYASGATTLSKLADVATGNALISGGVGVAPSYGKINLTTTVSGVLPEANGGTGNSTYTVGDILYASGATTLSKLADVATGNALISGGVGVAPSYGKINLTTTVTGTLPVSNGGTGLSSLATYTLLAGGTTTTGNIQQVSAGTAGQTLISTGSGALPSWADLIQTKTVTLTASDITNLHTTGYLLLDTPGAGKINYVLSCYVRLLTSTAFTSASGTIGLYYNNADGSGLTTGTNIISAVASNAFMTAGSLNVLGTINGGQDSVSYTGGATSVSNRALLLYNPGAAFTGGPAGATSSLTVFIVYQVITI